MATPTQSLTASLRSVTSRGPNTWTLRIDTPLSYQPGQSVAITLPGDPKKRYFSISSSPTEPGYIEITAKTAPDHPLAKQLPALTRGAAIAIEGPMGSLRMPAEGKNPLCFIAAGSGATPFRSMIKYLIDTESSLEYWLMHSVKSGPELLFAEEFMEWSGAQKRFHYVPTITQDFDNNWKNETGRINEALLRKHVPADKAVFLLCGPGDFVKDMEHLLKEAMKVPTEHIRREQW